MNTCPMNELNITKMNTEAFEHISKEIQSENEFNKKLKDINNYKNDMQTQFYSNNNLEEIYNDLENKHDKLKEKYIKLKIKHKMLKKNLTTLLSIKEDNFNMNSLTENTDTTRDLYPSKKRKEMNLFDIDSNNLEKDYSEYYSLSNDKNKDTSLFNPDIKFHPGSPIPKKDVDKRKIMHRIYTYHS